MPSAIAQSPKIYRLKNAGIHAPVSCFDFLRQAQVIIHREMDIQQVLVFASVYPVNFEPVIWSVRVTVKPILRTLYRASASCLIDETSLASVQPHPQKTPARVIP